MYIFDDNKGNFGPITDLRNSFDIRTGAMLTWQRIEKLLGTPVIGFFVIEQNQEVSAEQYPQHLINQIDTTQHTHIFINGRWGTHLRPPVPEHNNTAYVTPQGDVVSAKLTTEFVYSWNPRNPLPPQVRTIPYPTEQQLITHPWDILNNVGENLLADGKLLNHFNPIDPTNYHNLTVVGKHPVTIADHVTIHPQVVFDTSAGPILIDEHAEIRSMSVIVGPAYIGQHSAVANHAHLRAGTVIGPRCKVGGEICRCVFQGYANKAHGGYLGDSYVGHWVNLGAGTITSNLKNTYGEIAMKLDVNTPPKLTGSTHLGSIIGDHVKTAIGSRLNTGSVLSTGAMLAISTIAPKYVHRFAFLSDDHTTVYDWNKFCSVATQVMQRREQTFTQATKAQLETLYNTIRNRKNITT